MWRKGLGGGGERERGGVWESEGVTELGGGRRGEEGGGEEGGVERRRSYGSEVKTMR